VTEPDIWASKLCRLHEPKIEPLTKFGKEIHQATGEEIPYFDPDDGGVEARALFLLRDPGPTVRTTKFISRDNYPYKERDQTAKNFTEANKEACLPRDHTVSWNAVPWEVGQQKFDDELQKVIEDGWLFKLLQKLAQLKVVVLLGGDARKLTREVYLRRPNLHVLHGPHPSFRGSKNREKDRAWLKVVVRKAKDLIV
jgi:uracil-DNA glycosylase